MMKLTEQIHYVGVNDQTLDLFEAQYPLTDGVTYNSYVILDDKIAIIDTVDKRKEKEWLENIQQTLADQQPDYLIVSHMEPDHGACIQVICDLYPQLIVVGNTKTFLMIDQYFDIPNQRLVVKENDTLSLGQNTLQFVFAPMVHWPEVMMSYIPEKKLLFSADAFGTFGTHFDAPWENEARRYYTNIVGKYGLQVQAILKKAKNLDIEMICPLHGPILKDNLEQYIRYYDLWSRYVPEENGVFIACASIYGHTFEACEYLKAELEKLGETVVLADLSRVDVSEAVAQSFRFDRIVLASATYDGMPFSLMNDYLNHLKSKNLQNRFVAYIQNGTWAPIAAKAMKETIGTLKNMKDIEPVVTIKGAFKDTDHEQMDTLISAILNVGCDDGICM